LVSGRNGNLQLLRPVLLDPEQISVGILRCLWNITVPVAVVIFFGGMPVCALLDTIERRDSKNVMIKILPDPK
jgi:hypothetical protein